MRTRLGEHLVATGALTPAQLAAALEAQQANYAPLGQVLQRQGLITSDALARLLAEQLDLPYTDLTRTLPHADALAVVPRAVATTLEVLPLAWSGRSLRVAVVDPLDIAVMEELEDVLRAPVEVTVADAALLHAAIDQHYAAAADLDESLAERRATLRRRANTLAEQGGEPRLVGLAGAGGGIGLSHLVNNLAALAAAEARSVAVVDASLRPNPALLPPGWSAHGLGTDLLHGVVHTNGLETGEPGGVRFLGGATGPGLRLAKPGEYLTLAENLLVIGTHHSLLLCDLGGPPHGAATQVLVATDLPVLVLSPQDIVSAYDLLRDAAALRRQLSTEPALTPPWDVSIVVTFVETAAGGRRVFDNLDGAIVHHYTPEAPPGGKVRLWLAGTLPFGRDVAARAEATGTPMVMGQPESPVAQGARAIAETLFRHVDRLGGSAPPLAALIGSGMIRRPREPGRRAR